MRTIIENNRSHKRIVTNRRQEHLSIPVATAVAGIDETACIVGAFGAQHTLIDYFSQRYWLDQID